jgi:hypothetical protein
VERGSNSGIYSRSNLTSVEIRASQGLSTDVLHSWWKLPPPPQNTSAVVGNSNQRSISVGFVIVLCFFPKSPIGRFLDHQTGPIGRVSERNTNST